MSPLALRLRRLAHRQSGAASVEMVLALPLVMAVLFAAVDFGGVMLRQVFLDRATSLAVREVMLGRVPSNGLAGLRTMICQRSFLLDQCETSLAIELRPIDTDTWAGLDAPMQCVNRPANISPALTFNPSNGSQNLMLMRVCASVQPLLRITGMFAGLDYADDGDLLLVSIGAFTNEPT